MDSLAETVRSTGGMIGLFLTLITLFTNEQSRLRELERDRSGGPDPGALRRIVWLTGVLLTITTVTWLVLLPTAVDIMQLGLNLPPDPLLTLFVVTWILLVGLAIWQVTIILRCRSKP